MGIINKKLLLFFTFFSSFVFTGEILAQCDLEIYDFHPETLEITIIVNDGFGCNPNDPTDDEIDKFILGITSTELQADNFECGLSPETGWILQNYFPNFTLWDDEAAYLGEDGILNTGDTLTFNLFEAQLGDAFAEECYTEALNNGYFDDCIEVVIRQINCSGDIYGTNGPEPVCAGEEDGYAYPDVNLLDNIYDVFCATDLTFGPQSVFQFGCNVWDPDQFPSYNNDTWYWNFTGLDIYNQGFSTAHEYTLSFYYNNQFSSSVDYNSDLIDWISIPPEDNQYFSSAPINPSLIIGTDPLEEIKIVISDVFPGELDTTNNVLILTNLEDFIWDACEYLGCIDPDANNYNPNANVDDGSCEYDITELTYITAECSVDCDFNGPYYYVVTTWTNTGNVEITNFCAEWDVLGGEGYVQECYNGSLMPGDTVLLPFGPFNTNGSPVAWAYLQVINGVDLVPQIENYETLYCYGDAEASCVYGCTDQESNNYDSTADLDDGSCQYLGCTDPESCNYDPSANVDNGTCLYFDCLGECGGNAVIDECGICDGPGAIYECGCNDIPEGSCDCDGNVLDECGICGGPGAIYECGCYNIPEGDCDCNFNEFDLCGVCGGNNLTCSGCTDPEALNYEEWATVNDGSCEYQCDDPPVYVPNVVTPNNDGVNDVWLPVTPEECWYFWEVIIFNRWGNKVWETNNPADYWDISFQGGEYYVSDGVYTYIIRGRTYEPIKDVRKVGHITVFR